MMHDRGKSDSAIVATKPTNNAGQPAAEPVEPRAGTKRNAGEQSTHRASHARQDRQGLHTESTGTPQAHGGTEVELADGDKGANPARCAKAV